MTADDGAAQGARVVILAPVNEFHAESDRALRAAGLTCTRVPTAYEAAAEILRGPVAVLVIELRLLHRRHGRLLELARRHGVEILGVGGLLPNLDADALSGVRLVGRAVLCDEIRRALARTRPPAAPPTPPPAHALDRPEDGSPLADAPDTGTALGGESANDEDAPRIPEGQWERVDLRSSGGKKPLTSLAAVLTPEEVRALLEGAR